MQFRKFPAQFLFDPVQIEFGQFEDRQRLDAEPRNLPAQFRADRTAAAGDQHALAGQAGADRGPVELHRLAAEQVLDRDFLQLVEAHAPGNDVLQARHGAERNAGLLAQFDDALHLRVGRRRHRDQQHFGGDFAGQFRQLLQRAEHRHAVHLGAAQRGVVVEQADRPITVLASQFAHQRLAGATGAEHEHALGREMRGQIEAAVLPVAIRQARRAEQDDQHRRIDDQHGARHGVEAVVQEQRDGDRDRAEHAGAHDVPQVRQAGETPQALVQAGPPQHESLGEHGQADLRREPGQRRRIRLEAVAQPVGRDPGEPDHRQVVQHDGEARMDRGDQATRSHAACLAISLFCRHQRFPKIHNATAKRVDAGTFQATHDTGPSGACIDHAGSSHTRPAATTNKFQPMYQATTRACDMPERAIHWYRCSRCALYQRLPRSMRDSRLQLASTTKAEQAMRPLSGTIPDRLIWRSTAMPISRPSAPLPTSPMNTRARGKLNGTNASDRGGQRAQMPRIGIGADRGHQRSQRQEHEDGLHSRADR